MQTHDRQAPTALNPAEDPPHRHALVGVAAGAAVVLLLAVGVLVWGRVAPTEMVAMALTGLWFLAVLAGAALVARRHRHLILPLAVGYGLSAIAAGVLLGLPQLRDTTVDEQVATVDSVAAARGDAGANQPADEPAEGDAAAGGPADEPGGNAAAADEQQPDDAAPPGNTAVASGSFVDLAHPGSGIATVVDLADGGMVLTLTDFETDSGPDLRVYLTAQDPSADGEIGDFVDLGALKGNVGDQQYEIPDDVDVDALPNAVVWCRAFAVGFTSATLAAP